MLYSYLFFKCVVFNLYSNLYEKQILKFVNIKMSNFIVLKLKQSRRLYIIIYNYS